MEGVRLTIENPVREGWLRPSPVVGCPPLRGLDKGFVGSDEFLWRVSRLRLVPRLHLSVPTKMPPAPHLSRILPTQHPETPAPIQGQPVAL